MAITLLAKGRAMASPGWRLVAICSIFVSPAAAHPGGLNADGCHNNRKTGDYHCHRPAAPRLVQRLSSDGVYYPNCAAARAAGAAPVRRGDPGYGSHLDRDGDGKGCE
ncbi:excalibur calcium-binding domain-containing protein [Phenylobacterium sp. VNQ135]|uniref:excalibur calcium-binding domain-containing protein n=1 Tax=Phenylobacterium sp. VNQ135 TaxID=3400922 RepID=UPI003BFB1940